MPSAGQANILGCGTLEFRSTMAALVASGCASLLLVFGSGMATAQKPNELRSPSEFSSVQDPPHAFARALH